MSAKTHPTDEFVERFADVQILRYDVPGWDDLPRDQKVLAYHLARAAEAGRDIAWDQHHRYALLVRRTLENVLASYAGERDEEPFRALELHLKRLWFANGLHHHESMRKLSPGYGPADLRRFAAASDPRGFPQLPGRDHEALLALVEPVLFDPSVDPKRVSKDAGVDLVTSSAVNFYRDVTQAEVEAHHATLTSPNPDEPLSHGLNSQLAKIDGRVVERVWKVDGMYGTAIARIVAELRRALPFTENERQRAALTLLIAFYETGDLATFDRQAIAWVEDPDSRVDVVSGFIEVYGDPLGYRGTFESVVSFRDVEASRRSAAIAAQAQWFEDHAPIHDAHRKPQVRGISAKVITVVMEAGDCSPTTPIGINLPNATWIRERHGSKSVQLGNVVAAYDRAARRSGMLEEFCATEEELARARRHGTLASALHTDLHEVIGHASGRLEPGTPPPHVALQAYASTIEETRADLVALYWGLDEKLVEIGVMPSLDVGRTAYDDFVRNALLWQLRRVEPGGQLEGDHLRNRQLIARWCFERGRRAGVVERLERGGRTFFSIRDYPALRALFGELLREVQRITSQGDHAAARELVETYGVRVDAALHAEVLERAARLRIPPSTGFVNPRLVPERDAAGRLVDVHLAFDETFAAQHLRYARESSFLPDLS